MSLRFITLTFIITIKLYATTLSFAVINLKRLDKSATNKVKHNPSMVGLSYGAYLKLVEFT
jgi:hypothetical protein